MQKQDIKTREDIELLVHTFYGKVRKHETLGPIFNAIIQDWDEHLDRLTDFWQTNLLFVRAYKGNPVKEHILVDKHMNSLIKQEHFGIWLGLWFETLEELFEGKKSHMAKERARNMAHVLFLRIFQARQQDGNDTGIPIDVKS